MNLRGDSMDIVNICTAGLMLSSAVLFAGNAVYDYKFGKKATAAIRQFESGKPSSVIDNVLNQTLLVIAICTGIAFVFEELALHLQDIENVQAQYMVRFSLNVFILVGVQAQAERADEVQHHDIPMQNRRKPRGRVCACQTGCQLLASNIISPIIE